MDWSTILALGALVVVLMSGPQKIPDLARSLGRARREFDEASRGLEPTANPRTTTATPEPIVDVAQKLGINTEGKTRQEISDEIVRLAASKK